MLTEDTLQIGKPWHNRPRFESLASTTLTTGGVRRRPSLFLGKHTISPNCPGRVNLLLSAPSSKPPRSEERPKNGQVRFTMWVYYSGRFRLWSRVMYLTSTKYIPDRENHFKSRLCTTRPPFATCCHLGTIDATLPFSSTSYSQITTFGSIRADQKFLDHFIHFLRRLP